MFFELVGGSSEESEEVGVKEEIKVRKDEVEEIELMFIEFEKEVIFDEKLEEMNLTFYEN